MIKKSDDSFFQLSLTELAFILIFVVLLLIGAKVVLMEDNVSRCTMELGQCTQQVTSCKKDKDECYQALAKRGEDPDKVITDLVRAPALLRENEVLRRRNEQLEAEVAALADLKTRTPDPVRAKAAEDFLAGFEKDTKSSIAPKDARRRGEEVARLEKELADCRGQLTHCVKVTGASKGFGVPPCWADTSGRVQPVIDVEIRPDGLAVTKAWTSERENDARQLPNLQATVEANLQSLEQFKSNTLAIFESSKKANPECRHYAIIRKAPNTRDIDHFNRLRLGIQDHFYPRDETAR